MSRAISSFASSLARSSIRASQPRFASAGLISARRLYSTENLPAPGAGGNDPKITSIVEEISKLTLLQTADLVSQLKTRLNIQDIAMPVAMPSAPAAGGAAAPAEEEKPAEKTEFKVKLEKIDPAAKAKVIREVKNLTGMNLVEAKKFVESVPKVIKDSVPKEEAEKLKKALEALGATVVLE
ncbi:hypothetical protein NQZ79_g3436 [Umbelopsis isabellina]|nr:hypothetical protein NQZ79_g3436 [Umbelopsis isabellina]